MEEKGQPVSLRHEVVVSERSVVKITGVASVDNFDDQAVDLKTPLGDLHIGGSNLHITQLDLEASALEVEGHIESLTYRESKGGADRGRGLFSRLAR